MATLLLGAWTTALLGAGEGFAQTSQPAAPGVPPNAHSAVTGEPNAMESRMEQERQHMADDERHKRIVADTDKLLQLATQLKADVDKTTKNEMSMAVINKAAEIEKLSHDVKERMKN